MSMMVGEHWEDAGAGLELGIASCDYAYVEDPAVGRMEEP